MGVNINIKKSTGIIGVLSTG